MTDQNTPTLPGQGVGTPVAPVSAQEQSQIAVKPEQDPVGQKGEEAKPVTAADLAALKDDMYREIQSQVDKRNSRVQARVAEVENAVKILRDGGQEITDDTVKALKTKAAAEAMVEQTQSEVPTSGQPDLLDMNNWDPADPATRKIMDLQLEYGMEITSNMPQAAMIERGKGRVAFVNSYRAALEAVKAASSAPTSTVQETKTTPAARIPPSGSSGSQPRTAIQMLEEAHRLK